MENENSFIKYKNENLGFLDNEILNHLILGNKSDASSLNSSDDSHTPKGRNDREKEYILGFHHDEKKKYVEIQKLPERVGNNTRARNYRKSTTIINTNSFAWKLAERVADKQKTKLFGFGGDFNKSDSLRRKTVKDFFPLDEPDDHIVHMDGPNKHERPVLKIKSLKILEDDEETPIITEDEQQYDMSMAKDHKPVSTKVPQKNKSKRVLVKKNIS